MNSPEAGLWWPHSPHVGRVPPLVGEDPYMLDDALFGGTGLEGLTVEPYRTPTGAQMVRVVEAGSPYVSMVKHFGIGQDSAGQAQHVQVFGGLAVVQLAESVLVVCSRRGDQMDQGTVLLSEARSPEQTAVAAISFSDIVAVQTVRHKKMFGGHKTVAITVLGPGGMLGIDCETVDMSETPKPADIHQIEAEIVNRAVAARLPLVTDPAERSRLESLIGGHRVDLPDGSRQADLISG